MTHYIDTTENFISPQERTRIIGLCATITGKSEIAEDLAQETLLEAWRHLARLRDPEKRSQWLSGIARNVCYRWLRHHCRDQVHSIRLETSEYGLPDLTETIADAFDLEIELERKELAVLLDRALATLPLETRDALVKHYIDESLLAEIAAQLNTNASAIAMRLHRGKLALRRVLNTDLHDEITSYISRSESNEWEATRLWCTICGRCHLQGKLKSDTGYIELKCPMCCQKTGAVTSKSHYPALLKGVKGYKRALKRLETWGLAYYQNGLKTGLASCTGCGTLTPARRLQPGEAPEWFDNNKKRWIYGSDQHHGIAFICSNCETWSFSSSNGIVHWLPEILAFVREHPRVRTLPERLIEVDGRTAILTRIESVVDTAKVAVITDLETYEVLHMA